jgi:hypothetical protein
VRHVAGVGQAKLRPHVAGECGGVVRRRHLGQEGRGCGETGEIGMATVDCGCEMVWLDLAWPLLLLLGRLVNVDCSKVKTFFFK